MIEEPKRVVSRATTPETERVPCDDLTPRVNDTLIKRQGSLDPEYHAEALANAVVDNEAGSVPDEEIGGITPLKEKS